MKKTMRVIKYRYYDVPLSVLDLCFKNNLGCSHGDSSHKAGLEIKGVIGSLSEMG